MKLRFHVNQAEALRLGVNCPRSTVLVEVDPATIPQQERNFLSERMDGIDVCFGMLQNGKVQPTLRLLESGYHFRPVRITASLPTYESLMEAVRSDDAALHNRLDPVGA